MVEILKKNVKSLTLKVKPNGVVSLTVPLNIKDHHIEMFLNKKQSWIQKQLNNITPMIENNSPTKEYISGEAFLYLGNNCRLKIVENQNEYIELLQDYIYVYIKDKTNVERKKQLLQSWLREQSKLKFREILNELNSKLNLPYNNLYIRKMKTQWGSCSKANNITLNINLITKPKYCIEYVILHELIHLKHHNHSKNFYNMLTIHMPDWKWRKDQLEKNI